MQIYMDGDGIIHVVFHYSLQRMEEVLGRYIQFEEYEERLKSAILAELSELVADKLLPENLDEWRVSVNSIIPPDRAHQIPEGHNVKSYDCYPSQN